MERYLSAKEIISKTGLSKTTVYSMLRLPGFPATRIGKRIIVSERALNEWLANGGTEQKGA